MQRYPELPKTWTDPKEHLRLVALRVNGLLHGKSNNTGEVTLGAGTTTLVELDGILADSVVLLMPASAGAAGVAYHVTATVGAFTIHHAAGIANADFRYVTFG